MFSPHPFAAWVERGQKSAQRSARPRPARKFLDDDEFAVRRSRGRSVVVPRQRRGD